MTRHALQGRSEDEILWFHRRDVLRGAAAWIALGGWTGARAQHRGNVVQMEGDVLVNGQRLTPDGTVQTGDRVQTGPGSTAVFVIGNSAFQLRQNSHVAVERGDSLDAVSVLRLVSGGVISVWGRGRLRQIVAPTLTAGIRGTGVYTEVLPDQRTYFCNCYGVVELASGSQRQVSRADYHDSWWSEPGPGRLSPATPINHKDAELEFLAQLVDQRTAWQISGRKGNKPV